MHIQLRWWVLLPLWKLVNIPGSLVDLYPGLLTPAFVFGGQVFAIVSLVAEWLIVCTCFLFPISYYEQLLANTVFQYMYFIAIARLSHKPSRAGYIPAGDIKLIDCTLSTSSCKGVLISTDSTINLEYKKLCSLQLLLPSCARFSCSRIVSAASPIASALAASCPCPLQLLLSECICLWPCTHTTKNSKYESRSSPV